MSSIVPTIGRIVLYTLSLEDSDKINKRRTDTMDWMAFHQKNANGTMVHVGNYVTRGQQYPAMVVRVWGKTPESSVNLKVELDGSDTYWATSRMVGTEPGTYQWMDYQKGQAAKTEKAESNLGKDYATIPCRALASYP